LSGNLFISSSLEWKEEGDVEVEADASGVSAGRSDSSGIEVER